MQKHNARRFTSLAATALALATAAAGLVWADVLTIQDDNGEPRTCNYTDISIEPSDGSATIVVTDLESDACGGSSAVVTPPAPSIGVNGFSIEQGNDLIITYSTDDATSCSPTGNFGPWSNTALQLGTNLSETFQTGSVTAQSYTVGLNCSNSAGSGSDSANFQITEPGGGGTDCPPDRQPPNGMTRATSCLLGSQSGTDCTSYSAVFGGVPGTTSVRHFALDRNEYAAMAFSLPNGVPSTAEAQINARELQNPFASIADGPVVWSISSCPGDFNVDAISQELDSACVKSGLFAQNGFSFGGSSFINDSDVCALPGDPGKVFYLNVVYSPDNPATTPSTELDWSCTDPSATQCGNQMQLINVQGW